MLGRPGLQKESVQEPFSILLLQLKLAAQTRLPPEPFLKVPVQFTCVFHSLGCPRVWVADFGRPSLMYSWACSYTPGTQPQLHGFLKFPIAPDTSLTQAEPSGVATPRESDHCQESDCSNVMRSEQALLSEHMSTRLTRVWHLQDIVKLLIYYGLMEVWNGWENAEKIQWG